MHSHKLDVERPDPVVLGGWQSTQSSVKHAPGPGHLALLGEELAVVNPDPRHLVHEDQAALEAVVHLIIAGVSYTPAFDLFPPDLRKYIALVVLSTQKKSLVAIL